MLWLYAVSLSSRQWPTELLISTFHGLGFHVSKYRLLQLRIHFVCDGDYVPEHLTKIHGGRVFLEHPKDGDFKDARFVDNHRDGVALFIS